MTQLLPIVPKVHLLIIEHFPRDAPGVEKYTKVLKYFDYEDRIKQVLTNLNSNCPAGQIAGQSNGQTTVGQSASPVCGPAGPVCGMSVDLSQPGSEAFNNLVFNFILSVSRPINYAQFLLKEYENIINECILKLDFRPLLIVFDCALKAQLFLSLTATVRSDIKVFFSLLDLANEEAALPFTSILFPN